MAQKYPYPVIVANITWNPHGWRSLYTNPKAGHRFAQNHPGHESLNFIFNKKGLDDSNNIYGYIQWTNPPKHFQENGVIIFYSKNLDNNRGEIVGIYGQAKILTEPVIRKWKGFERGELISNIVAQKQLSMLLPIPLNARKYSGSARLVPQVGFTYKDADFSERVLRDEINALRNAGIRLSEYERLLNIYRLTTGREFDLAVPYYDIDQNEQDELSAIISKQKREKIIEELKALTSKSPILVTNKGKQYKRDNKTVAQLKFLRGYKCQICQLAILKKNNTHYVEAAHIIGKRHKGPEAPENILILCPNHHKEFDLGARKIISHDKDKVTFILNGNKYNIDLSLK